MFVRARGSHHWEAGVLADEVGCWGRCSLLDAASPSLLLPTLLLSPSQPTFLITLVWYCHLHQGHYP